MKYEFNLPVYGHAVDYSILLNKNNCDEIKAMIELGQQYYDAATLCHRMALHMRISNLSVSSHGHAIVVDGPQETLIKLANER